MSREPRHAPTPPTPTPRVIEKGIVQTALGAALRISVERADRGVMSFAEVRAVLAEQYPKRWAIQCIPPAAHYIDQVNRYHFHLIDTQPEGLDLFDTQEPQLPKAT